VKHGQDEINWWFNPRATHGAGIISCPRGPRA